MNGLNIQFSIITPTLLRDSLIKTCSSLNMQTYRDWEHIVMIDVDKKKVLQDQHLMDIIKVINHPQRKIAFCDHPHNNYGNTCRHDAYTFVKGDYMGFIDDDDYFVHHAFEVIYEELCKIYQEDLRVPDGIYFPCFRHGSTFFNKPLGVCMTATSQYMVRPIVDGKPTAWLKVPDNDIGYCYDGEYIEHLKKFVNFVPICESDKGLTIIEKSSHAKK